MNITPSDKDSKKFKAVFETEKGKTKTVHFGQKNADDYTLKKDILQRDRYRARHAKDLETGDPTKAGYLSNYTLWGDSTSMATNISNYKKKCNLY